jgi:non-ribosomal peptide synthetase component F
LTTNNVFQLSCTIDELEENTLKVTLDYDPKTLNSDVITGFANDFQEAIKELRNGSSIDYDFIYSTQDDENLPFKNVMEMIFEQCDLRPDSIAIELPDGEQISYFKLKSKITKNMHYLKKHLSDTMIVPILLDMNASVEWILSSLACGFAYCPIDPNQPLIRIHSMIKQLDASFVVSDKEVNGLNILNINYRSENCTYVSSDQFGSSSDLAYVIFTSGSTGEPKGVCIEHRQLSNFVQRSREQFNINEKSVVGHSINSVFDVSIFNMFVTLASGGRLVQKNKIIQFVETKSTKKLTHLTLPSAIFNSLTNEKLERLHEYAEWVMVGGETPSSEALSIASKNGLKISQFYGPTETTVWCSVNHYKDREFDGQNIGRLFKIKTKKIFFRYHMPVIFSHHNKY